MKGIRAMAPGPWSIECKGISRSFPAVQGLFNYALLGKDCGILHMGVNNDSLWLLAGLNFATLHPCWSLCPDSETDPLLKALRPGEVSWVLLH